jgi:tetratricopeptide (TPR) repeat protein
MMRAVRVATLIGALAVGTMLLAAAPAHAFRYVELGASAPSLSLPGIDGGPITTPAADRLTLVTFWRPGQRLSEDAVTDLIALRRQLGSAVEIVAIAESGTAAESLRTHPAAAPLRLAVDHDGRAAERWGVIVFPSTALVASGRLVYYLPSRPDGYRGLLAARIAHARHEIDDATLSARLETVAAGEGSTGERAQAAYRRGVAFAAERRWQAAADAFGEALALAPDHVEARTQLGYMRLEQAQPAEALREFEQVLERTPSPAARVGAGIARLRLGGTDEGIRALEEAVVLNPEPVRGHWELARAYEARGDLDRALDHYRWAYRKLLQGRK